MGDGAAAGYRADTQMAVLGHDRGMADRGTRAHLRRAVVCAALVGVVALGWFALRADQRSIGGSTGLTVLDLVVGAAFLLAAAVARGDTMERVQFGAIGPAWLAGSLSVSALSLHQGVLLLALAAFPTGRPIGVVRWALVACAALVVLEVVPQLGVAALFCLVAVVALVSGDAEPADRAFPAAAGAAVAASLIYSWWNVRQPSHPSSLVVYGSTLVGVAIAFPVACHFVRSSRARLADRVIGDARLVGLPGLRLVLAEIVKDPRLMLDVWDPETCSYANVEGGSCGAAEALVLSVTDHGEPLARVQTTSVVASDQQTRAAIVDAVRLAVLNDRLLARTAQAVADVQASRSRLLASTDRERARVSHRLELQVGPSLRRAHETLAAAASLHSDVDGVIVLSATEIAMAAEEVERIVSGAPPEQLGGGRLTAALDSLVAGLGVPCRLTSSGDAAADADVEKALFYVCSEALANVSKHAAATYVTVDLTASGDDAQLTVHDDGRGGADPTGSGLRGMVDRISAAGGRLVITSPRGYGTTIVASVPSRK